MIFYSFETKLSMRVHEFFLKNGCNNADLSSVSHIMTRTGRNVGGRKISKAAPDFKDGVKKTINQSLFICLILVYVEVGIF